MDSIGVSVGEMMYRWRLGVWTVDRDPTQRWLDVWTVDRDPTERCK